MKRHEFASRWTVYRRNVFVCGERGDTHLFQASQGVLRLVSYQ